MESLAGNKPHPALAGGGGATPKPASPLLLLPLAVSLPHLKQLHAQILRSTSSRNLAACGGLPEPFLSKLLSFPLGSPSALDYALAAFLHPPSPLANRALRALSRAADPRWTVAAYARVRRAGIAVGRFSVPPVLRAATKTGGMVEVGREVHGMSAKMGFDSDPFVQTALVGIYAAVGFAADARKMFDRMTQRDLVAWSVMLDGYCQAGRYTDALDLFDEMTHWGIPPDSIILSTALSACGRSGDLSTGKSIHNLILSSPSALPLDSHLRTALISMYSSCGSMPLAQSLFDALSPSNPVASTAMVSGYARLGDLSKARSIFDRMLEKDIVSWTAMISGYAESDRPAQALALFNDMRMLGARPDRITMLSVVSACAHLGALDKAKWVHVFVDRNGFCRFPSVGNALIDMYSKCGSLEDARMVFDGMTERNVITWTSMITGLAMHGEAVKALEFFERMKAEGIEPNRVTFVGLLYACSHAGLVEKGRRVFKSMVKEHGLEPEQEHYGCMVDLLGRAKLLQEAVDLIESMPFRPNVVVWGSLLAACRIHGEVRLGEIAAKKILEIDLGHDGAYVLLSNIYAKARKWEEVGEVRRLMKFRGVLKEKGCSWIELEGEVHEFVMGDESHSKSKEIYQKLDEVVKELEGAGYAPDVGSVLVDLDEEEKRGAILLHSEKLALSLGLINSDRGSCIRIAKNLRVCEDCHSFMKMVSKVFEREIVVRDRTRFHHYRDGICSCGDFW